MKKKIIALAAVVPALLALMLLNILPGVAAKAATDGATGDIGFYVRAVLPENQTDPALTYFDLRVRPGQTQTLQVEVVNETASPITVDIEAISASTNRNGVIDYKTPGIQDKTLLHPFSQLAALESGSLEIPALGSATARVTIALPAGEYDGVVLGGLVFTRRPEAEAQKAAGTALQNVYSYVIGVKLSENDTPVLPEFELDGVQGQTVNYQPAMVHLIRNRTAAIAKNVDLHVVVLDENGHLAAEAELKGVDMAPNSVMPLAVAPVPGAGGGEDGQGMAPGALLPGSYTSVVTLGHGGQSWSLEQSFTIGSVQAESVNAESIGNAPQGGGVAFSTVLIVALAAAGVVILVLFIILMRLLRRREETKELNRLMRERRRQISQQSRWRQQN